MGKLRSPLEGDVFRWFKAAMWTRPQTGCVSCSRRRSRALEGISGVQLTERRNFLTAKSGPAQWAAWGPQWRLRVPWKWHLPGPSSGGLCDGWIPEASAEPSNIPEGRGDRKEQVNVAMGPGSEAQLTVP